MAVSAYCDIGVYFRKWMLAIDEVRKWVHNHSAIVDTIDGEGCKRPFIWYSRSGSENSNTLSSCGGGLELVKFELEVIAEERKLGETRRIAEALRLSADAHERSDPFGDPNYKIQLIEIVDVDDRYQPKAIHFLEGICFTALAVEISPIIGR